MTISSIGRPLPSPPRSRPRIERGKTDRMKRVLFCLLLFCLGLAIAGTDATRDAQRAISANYAAIAKAFVAKNFDAFSKYLTDDFTASQPGGRDVNREEVVKEFEGQRASLSKIQWTKKIVKIQLDGDVAHVSVDGRMASKIEMGKGKFHDFLLTASSL